MVETRLGTVVQASMRRQVDIAALVSTLSPMELIETAWTAPVLASVKVDTMSRLRNRRIFILGELVHMIVPSEIRSFAPYSQKPGRQITESRQICWEDASFVLGCSVLGTVLHFHGVE